VCLLCEWLPGIARRSDRENDYHCTARKRSWLSTASPKEGTVADLVGYSPVEKGAQVSKRAGERTLRP
jgi:hypothetical protein